jgi:hypothetical protein
MFIKAGIDENGIVSKSVFIGRTSMNQKTIQAIALATVTLVAVPCAALPGRAQDAKNPYPTSVAPLDQYLMDRNDEIALARSAAPPSIAKDATVMVLGKDGYETAVQGTNGFVCNVDRSWMDAFENTPEFWNPKRRGPICFNPEAAKTLVPLLMIRTRLALAGKSKAEMKEGLKAAIEKGELPAIEPSGMAYMMSKQGRLTDRDGHWLPHLMFYVPVKDAKTWGANLPNSPVSGGPADPEPISYFIVPVGKWSDGTPADDHSGAH